MASVNGTIPTDGFPGAPTWTVCTVTTARGAAAAAEGQATLMIAAMGRTSRPIVARGRLVVVTMQSSIALLQIGECKICFADCEPRRPW